MVLSTFFMGGCSNNNLKVEEEKDFVIELFYAPTAGEFWEYEVSSSDVVEILEDYKSDCDENVDGCGGRNIYKIIPKKEGVTTITFTMKHISDIEYSTFAKYTITVDKDLKITESHTGTYFNE